MPTGSAPFLYLLVPPSGLSATAVVAGEYVVGEGILVLGGDEATLCCPCVSIISSNWTVNGFYSPSMLVAGHVADM